MSNNRILECPCCKGRGELQGYKFRWVSCLNCGLSTKTCETKEEAINIWNKRAPIDTIANEINEASFPQKFANETKMMILKERAMQIICKERNL